MSEMLVEVKQSLISEITSVIKKLEPDCPNLQVTVSDDLTKIYVDGVSQRLLTRR